MALLVDPSDPAVAETTTNQMRVAARTLGLELHVLNASTVNPSAGMRSFRPVRRQKGTA